MKQLQLSDLKTGMILEYIADSQETAQLAMVLLGTDYGDIIAGETWQPLTSRTLNGIVAVWQPKTPMNYLQKSPHGYSRVGLSTDGCELLYRAGITNRLTTTNIVNKTNEIIISNKEGDIDENTPTLLQRVIDLQKTLQPTSSFIISVADNSVEISCLPLDKTFLLEKDNFDGEGSYCKALEDVLNCVERLSSINQYSVD